MITLVYAASCSKMQKSPTGLAAGLGANSSDLIASGDLPPYNENPVAQSAQPLKTSPPAAANIHGTFSVQDFMGWMPELNHTHESAAGFRKYLARWYAPNFVYRDTGVGAWAFLDDPNGDEDTWESKGVERGVDAVLVAYHSSHGNMRADGIYMTWMGTNITGKGWSVRSDHMALGGGYDKPDSERLRYMFWDTCYGLRFRNGQNPMRTWAPHAKGIRMIFGYESPSLDSPNYGQFFWEEWNKNKSLSTAFLDASWRICRQQTPVVLAFGATDNEASARRDGERLLFSEGASSQCGAWRWYSSEAGSAASQQQAGAALMPTHAKIFDVAADGNSDTEVERIAQSVGIMVVNPSAVEARPFGMRSIRTKGLTLTVGRDGSYELALTTKLKRTASASAVANDAELIQKAKDIISEFDLAQGSDYQFSVMRFTNVSSGTVAAPSGNPVVVEKTAIFDQIVNGLPFIDPDAGHLEITFDAQTGEAKKFRNTIHRIRDNPTRMASASAPALTIEQARDAALQTTDQTPSPGEPSLDAAYEIKHENESTGYYILDGKAIPVYRAYITSRKFPEARPREVLIPLAKAE